MIKAHQIRKIKKDCSDFFQENRASSLEVTGSGFKRNEFLFDRKIRDNFVSELLSGQSEEHIVIEGASSSIEVSGTGFLHIKVKSSSKILFSFSQGVPTQISITVDVEEGADVLLTEVDSHTQIIKDLQVYSSKNSKITFAQLSSSSMYNTSSFFLGEKSNLTLVSSYLYKDSKTFIKHSAHHTGSFSESELDVQGVALGAAQVFSEGLVAIEHQANNSSGHQLLKGILLDEEASISAEPILEVATNSVSCSHGASVSRLQDSMLLYLKSRGLDEDQIKELVVSSLVNRISNYTTKIDDHYKEKFQIPLILG